MTRAPALCGVLLALCACSALPRRQQAPAAPPDAAVEVNKREFRLFQTATQADFAVFQRKVDAAYAYALAQSGGEADFVYSLSPAGASNPFSSIEVACIMPQAHARGKSRVCETFFGKIQP